MDEAPTLLDQVITPTEAARRIQASSGVAVSARTIWEKARRIGIAKKLGRDCFLLISDIPKLMEPESAPRGKRRGRIDSTAAVIRLLRSKK